ncbi:ECF transporter S component [Niallia sp. MER 6]|uniref:ECF transporter S component n=1 Tax=Niallia sp. MER 6 TaxID=2939567 RepID=UPI00203E3803|nr:ECF transporter S component [Niallia sp. MER 6]MCM3031324.1 ECF transporter S component [Niallia sp. MER 6]
MNKKKMNVRKFVLIGMMSSMAFVLMFIKFPLPTFPPFLTLDFSDLPALVTALILGPVAGILVELIKNLLDYIVHNSEIGIPVGNLANFIAGVAFILPAYFIYNKLKSKLGMVLGLISSALVMSIALSFFNYFVLLPVYIKFIGWDSMTSAEMRAYVISLILPFNLIKGAIVSALFLLVFTKMKGWITKQAQYRKVA